MERRTKRFPVYDSDAHVNDNRDIWKRHAPESPKGLARASIEPKLCATAEPASLACPNGFPTPGEVATPQKTRFTGAPKLRAGPLRTRTALLQNA